MSVVGVDIGSYSTHIAVARLGAVEVIDNDYSLRATPSIVAYGDRQRFIGVAAENQKTLNPRHTVSNFKSCVGLNFKNTENFGDRFGAKSIIDSSGKLLFQVRGDELTPEQVLATLFTKVNNLVHAAESNDEPIETLVVSVPVYFTQAQRQAVLDAAAIAGLHINEIISDASALALNYGKSKDIAEGEKRNVVLVDVGSEGTQAVVVELESHSARVLASAHNHVGGRLFDDDLVNYAVNILEEKYKINIRDNVKVKNRLRNILEKSKKQMSANTNKIPVQIDSLVEDKDVSFTIDRAEFEKLIESKVATIKETLEDLLASTTVKPEDLHSVEIVGGSTRIPAIKQVIQDVIGHATSTTLNADEAIARGCALYAASLSSKFITKKYEVTPAVHYGIEAMIVHGEQHEKVLVCDSGDSITGPVSLEITADLPLNIALQYTESSTVDDKFIALYKVDRLGPTESRRGVMSLKFKFNSIGAIELKEVLLTAEEIQRRSTFDPNTRDDNESEDMEYADTTELAPCRTILDFVKSMPELRNIGTLRDHELAMIKDDQTEISRQEEKNNLEELLFKCRHEVEEYSEEHSDQEVYTNITKFFEETENWLYEEGEGAPRNSYLDMATTLHKKMKVFTMWVDKFQQMKTMEKEKKRFMERQQQQQREREEYDQAYRQHRSPPRHHRSPPSHHRSPIHHRSPPSHHSSPPRQERNIPVVYEGDDHYVPIQHQQPQHPHYHPQHQQPQHNFQQQQPLHHPRHQQPPAKEQSPPATRRFSRRPDPFFANSIFDDTLFGSGW